MSNLKKQFFRFLRGRINCLVISFFFVLLPPVATFADPASSALVLTNEPELGGHSDSLPADREIRVTNGVRTTVGQYPFLTAVLSGRQVSLRFEDGPSSALFFSGGVLSEFSGELVDCGFAINACLDVTDKVCSIILDFPVADHVPLTPSQQLQNCRRGGGIGAVFRPNSRNYTERLDLFDGNPRIPAVYLNDEEGYQHLLLALAEGKLGISAIKAVPDTALCGGTYLGGRWVLTAAHCVVRKLDDGSFRVVNASELLVNVGAYNLTEEKIFTQGVEQILINDYRITNGWDENDYALVKLDADPLRGEAINLATEESLDSRVASSEAALVVGWGSTEVREPLSPATLATPTSRSPLAATLQMQTVQSCRTLWRDFLLLSGVEREVPDIRDIHLCASSEIQQDTCQGDSGGPLMIDVNGELQVAGITSFGLGCGGSLGLPAVYARVPAFRQWVLEKTGLTLAQQDVRVLSADSLVAPTAGGGGSLGGELLMLLAGLWLSLKSTRYVRKFPVVFVAIAALSGCAADQENDGFAIVAADSANTTEAIDAVYNSGVISAVVVSTGCTQAEHFQIVQTDNVQRACEIEIRRIKPDLCKRAAQAHSISINWSKPAECENVIVANLPLSRD